MSEEENVQEEVAEEAPKKVKKKGAEKAKYVGLDIGTSFIHAAYEKGDSITYNTIRSAFIKKERDPRTLKMLKNLKHPFIDDEKGNTLFIVGEPAIDLSNMFSEEVQRPMAKGVLSPSEKDAIQVMRMMITEVLKDIVDKDTTVVYSSPADPADGSFSTLYHQQLMKKVLEEELGVKASPMNEAHALGYSELADDGFTGLCFSFGAGMVNAVFSYAGIDALSFSIGKGGDWIDAQAATARGKTASQIQSAKEQGIDLIQPQDADAEALAIYYRALITEAIQSFNTTFADSKDKPQINKPIPVIVAGGTSLAQGFLDLFKAIVEEKGFPFEIKEIRQAEDPLKSVTEGLLLAAEE
jgi:hypothetical protein